jgi:hypothetical protein
VAWDSLIGQRAAAVHLPAGAERLDLQALITHAAQGLLILRERWVFTTTYATTYGRVSAGIRRELMAPPQSEKRLGRDQTGPNGTKGKLWTPSYESEGRRFESCRARQRKSCKCSVFSLMKCSRRSVRTTHLTTYLFRNRLAGPVRSDRIAPDPDARNVAWVGILWRCAWTHDRFYESNKTTESILPCSLRDLSTASNRLTGELGDLISSVNAAARSPMSFSSIRSTI